MKKTSILVAKKIVDSNNDGKSWALAESDDMFQEGSYIGGYDADEEAFFFSYFDQEKEYWFQLSMNDITKVALGDIKIIDIRESDL